MSYMPRPQAPRISRAQAERNNRWWQWKREQARITREAFECFKVGDVDGFKAKSAEAEALPEPDTFNGGA